MLIVENKDYDHIISWNDDGTSFTFHDRKAFEKEVICNHFKPCKFRSFLRKVRGPWNSVFRSLFLFLFLDIITNRILRLFLLDVPLGFLEEQRLFRYCDLLSQGMYFKASNLVCLRFLYTLQQCRHKHSFDLLA